MPFLSMMYLYLQWSVFCFLMSWLSSRILSTASFFLSLPSQSCLSWELMGIQGQRMGQRTQPEIFSDSEIFTLSVSTNLARRAPSWGRSSSQPGETPPHSWCSPSCDASQHTIRSGRAQQICQELPVIFLIMSVAIPQISSFLVFNSGNRFVILWQNILRIKL